MDSGSGRIVTMLAAALEKEEKGREFYQQAAEKSSNALGKDFFRDLAIEEGVHISRIKHIYSSLTSGSGIPTDWSKIAAENPELSQLVRTRGAELGSTVTANTGDIEAIDVAISMEQGAISFYTAALDASVDKLEKEFIQKMLLEERGHFGSLQDLKLFFTDPKAWFDEKERPTYDG